MGEWKTIYEDEVEERWVTLKVYESEDDGTGMTSGRPRHGSTHADEAGEAEQRATGWSPLPDEMRTTTRSHWILTPLRISRKNCSKSASAPRQPRGLSARFQSDLLGNRKRGVNASHPFHALSHGRGDHFQVCRAPGAL